MDFFTDAPCKHKLGDLTLVSDVTRLIDDHVNADDKEDLRRNLACITGKMPFGKGKECRDFQLQPHAPGYCKAVKRKC